MSSPYQYPSIFAGSRITAGLLTSMEPTFVVKPASTTRTSTIIISADPDLQFAVTSGGMYLIEFQVIYGGIIAAGMATTWSVPSGTSGTRTCTGSGFGAANSAGQNIGMNDTAVTFTTQVNYGCARNAATSYQLLTETAIVTASATGTVAFSWAQQASSTTGVIVVAGSWGRCTELQ